MSTTAAKFFGQFIRNPVAVAAVLPTSRATSAVLADAARVQEADTVIEMGAGTGAITRVIQEKLKPGCRFLPLEINEDFVKYAQEAVPELGIVHGSATDAAELLEEHHGVAQCDAIVSGLPLAVFSDQLQDDILGAVLRVLRPGGRFVCISYLQSPLLPGGRAIRRKLRDRFAHVSATNLVWANVPPAFGYIAVAPETP